MNTTRRKRLWLWTAAALLLLGLGTMAYFFIPGLFHPSAEYWPARHWRTSTPEQQGFDSVKLADGLQSLREQKVGINSLLIVRNGYLVLDAYFYPYESSFPHDMASVTKSITTTLIAMAAGQGKLQLDQPMVSYFPDRTIANLDDLKKSMTVRQLAGMVNGMESGCLKGDEATLAALRSTPDWVQAALDRKMIRQPGTSFCYDSPGMHLLSAILQETTGTTELDFARKYLFEPLGIQDVYWRSDPQGYTRGWGDMWLKPPDAARIGYLFLHHGMWDGRQIVPADCEVEAVKAHTQTGTLDDYGYGWWVADISYFAEGRGGQFIRIYPADNAIVVATANDLDYRSVESILDTAFVDPGIPLPANPQGAARLNALVTELGRECLNLWVKLGYEMSKM